MLDLRHLILGIILFRLVHSASYPPLYTEPYREDTYNPTQHPNWKLLDQDVCGNSVTDRIIGGKNATMGQYPWIARVGYASKSRPRNPIYFKCGGSLISACYVVTAAHCISKIPRDLYIAGVRLGEHDEETDIDCYQGYCGDHVQDFYPDRILVHKNYGTPTFKNDIALIKLDRKAAFNNWVKPICLPHGSLMTKNFIGQNAEVAGWGIYNIKVNKGSRILQTVKLPFVHLARCIEDYDRKLMLDHKQLCAGGVIGQDSCGGDSGGPLMKVEMISDYPRYYLLGLVSFGSKMCGDSKTPAVYTKITEYLPWILNNIDVCS